MSISCADYKNYSKPIDVELELSNVCNADCPLCYRNNKNYIQTKPYHRPLNEIIKQLDTEYFSNLESIKLVGTISEPTLYKDLFALIDYINYRDLEIEICTNGDTHNTEWWEHLGKLLKPKDKVYFTICGSTQELHEVYRKNTNLDNIIKNVKAFQNNNLKIDYAQLIKFNYNENDFKNMANNYDNSILIHFSNLYWTETFLSLPLENYKRMDNDLYDKLLPNSEKLKLYKRVESKATKLVKENKIEPDCIAKLDGTCQLNLNGFIFPCYLFLENKNCIMNDFKWDYIEIKNGTHNVCKFCDKGIKKLLNNLDLRYII